MCQIIPVRLVRLLHFTGFISEGVINIGLLHNESLHFLPLVLFPHAETVGSADFLGLAMLYVYIICICIYIYIYIYIYIHIH